MTPEPTHPEIRADLNACREDGRIRLTIPVSLADIERMGIAAGALVWLVDEDVRLEAIVEWAEEGPVARVLDRRLDAPLTTAEIQARWEKAGVQAVAKVDHEVYGYGFTWEGEWPQAKVPPGHGKLVAPLAHAFADVAHLLEENAELRRKLAEPNPWRGLVEEIVHELRNALLPGTIGEGPKREARAQAGLKRGLDLTTRLAKALDENKP